ncbi:TetR family transcriptional regulator [Oceanococcus atlanticus]|uniref:TetR family transcriptional regulator n=1 Tax=Oceanococcus atlanticus TaxID=1317117 RepID=A0A1Y1SFJ4_9GAMM|nr:TetR/AcrR family transcriptional regulator [Oceanococcus atlanticus]ORE87463.1 TetR family transcriptional regulator [Oceanococcus atlanticus]
MAAHSVAKTSRKPRPAKRRPQARGLATRERLLSAAETLFIAEGYDPVGVERIVAAADVTKGAFYHHFGDKLAIFREVFEAIDQEMADRVRARALTAETPLGMVQRGVRSCFELCTQPRYGRFVYITAPPVIGWTGWYETDNAISREIVMEGLQNAVELGELAPLSVASLTTLLMGLVLQGAIAVVNSDTPQRTAQELADEADHILLALAAQARSS